MLIKKSLLVSIFFIAVVLILFPLTSLCLADPPQSFNTVEFEHLGITVNVPDEYYLITDSTNQNHSLFLTGVYDHEHLMAHLERSGFNHVIIDKDTQGETYVSAISYDYYDYSTLSDSEFEDLYHFYRDEALAYGIEYNEYSILEADNATYLVLSGRMDFGGGDYQNMIEVSSQVDGVSINFIYYKSYNSPLTQTDFDLVSTLAINTDYSEAIESDLISPDQLLDSLADSSAGDSLGDRISGIIDANSADNGNSLFDGFADNGGSVAGGFDFSSVTTESLFSVVFVVGVVIIVLLALFVVFLFLMSTRQKRNKQNIQNNIMPIEETSDIEIAEETDTQNEM